MHNPSRMSVRKLSPRSSFGLGLLASVVLPLVLLVGCGGADNRPAKWSFIAPAIIEPNCATVSCHSAVAQRAGVILDTRETAYSTLTKRGFVVACPTDNTACMNKAAATSEILSWSRSQGLFAGLALEGATLRQDLDDNQSIYGNRLENRDIVTNKRRIPAVAAKLIALLNKYSAREEAHNPGRP